MSPAGKHAAVSTDAAVGLTVSVVAGRFNGDLVDRLIERALVTLEELGLPRESVTVHRAPGAFELPLLARAVIERDRPDCVIALGVVIRGETPHFDFIAGEAARGLQSVTLETGIPVAFGVITAGSAAQAEARTRPPLDRGAEAARAAVEMARTLARLHASGEKIRS